MIIDKKYLEQLEVESLEKEGFKEIYDALTEILEDMLENEHMVIPVLPQVAEEIIAIIDHRNISFAPIIDLIKKDPVISAKMLAVANSPYYASSYPVTKVDEIVRRIGFEEIKRIVFSISISVFNSQRGSYAPLYREFWEHSISTALLAQDLNLENGDEIASSAYIGGLLHDIGRTFVVAVIEEIERHLGTKGRFGTKLVRRISEKLHTQFGDYIGEKWNLPSELHFIIAYHHDPEKLQSSMLFKSISCAEKFADYIGWGDESDKDILELQELFASIGFSFEEMDEKKDIFITKIKKLIDLY